MRNVDVDEEGTGEVFVHMTSQAAGRRGVVAF